MLTLYSSSTCAFSQRIIQMAENLKVELEVKDIYEDESAKSELLEKGGMDQVPYLVDTDKDVAMYESSDIIDYIRDNYANSSPGDAVSKPRVHISSSVCESCEG